MTFNSILIEGGRGAIECSGSSLSPNPVLLPYIFNSKDLADKFLASIERSGVSLYPDMGYTAMKQLYCLWWDAWKRPA